MVGIAEQHGAEEFIQRKVACGHGFKVAVMHDGIAWFDVADVGFCDFVQNSLFARFHDLLQFRRARCASVL